MKYRLLLAEDNTNDVELIRRTLQRSALELDLRTADRKADFVRELQQFQPDLVLCDFRLVDFDGHEAIHLARAHQPGMPVIIVSGTLGDELAAGLVRAGAVDYVLKDRLARLPAAITRAIADRERRLRQERAEQESRLQQERLLRLYDSSLDGIVVLGSRGEILDANNSALSVLGRGLEELLGKPWIDVVASASDETPPEEPSEPFGVEGNFRKLIRAIRPDGAELTLDMTYALAHEPSGHAIGMVVFRDITHRILIEAELKKERELQSLLKEIAENLVLHSDILDSLHSCLRLIARYADWPVAHLFLFDRHSGSLVSTDRWVGADDSRLAPFRDASTGLRFAADERTKAWAFVSDGPAWTADLADEERFLRREAAQKAGLVSALAVPVIAEGVLAGVFEFFAHERRPVRANMLESLRLIGRSVSRIFERRWFDETIRRRQREVETLVDHAPDVILRFNRENRISFVNARIEDILGVTPNVLLGRQIDEIADITGMEPESVEAWDEVIRNVFEAGRPADFGLQFSVGGKRRYLQTRIVPECDEEGTVVSALGFWRDITAQAEAQESLKRSEEQLHHAQRLESVGRLAGGVAHDFNNILTAVMGYLHLLETAVEPESGLADYLTNIRKAVDRAARLTHQLLLFSRKVPAKRAATDVNQLIVEIARMLSRLLGGNVSLETDLSADVPAILADAGKMEQVIMNLVVNARDAMPDGGRIVIETARESATKPANTASAGEGTDEIVRISVRDNGTGMDEETRSRVFEPFFTTKPREKGTGLGLSVVYGICEEHGATIEVESELGAGSVFHLRFPTKADHDPTLESAETARGANPRIESVHILLVEDDSAIRETSTKALENAGARVTAVKSIRDAENAARSQPNFDLVFSDVSLPDGSGSVIPSRLGLEVPYIFSSGYMDDSTELDRIRAAGYVFVQKPYRISELVATIGKVMDTWRQK